MGGVINKIADDWFGIDPPSPPKVPDPQQTAETQQQFAAQQAALQAQYNLDALRTNISANRLDQDTPFGSIRYIQTGIDPYGNPTYGAQTQFTDDQQSILDQLEQNQLLTGGTAQNLLQNTSDMYGNPIDLPTFNSSSGVPEMPDFSTGADSVVTQAMDRQLAYLQPYHTKALENLHTELVNRGLTPGNPAYDAEMRRIRQSQSESVGQFLNTFQNQAYTQQLDTYRQALARQQQGFGQELGQHQEQTKEALQEYGLPLETIKSLLGLGSPNSVMGFANVPGANLTSPNVGNVDFAGIQNQVQQALNQVYQMQLGQYNADAGAIGSGISTILGAPAGTLFGGANSAIGGGLANMLNLNPGSSPMRLF